LVDNDKEILGNKFEEQGFKLLGIRRRWYRKIFIQWQRGKTNAYHPLIDRLVNTLG